MATTTVTIEKLRGKRIRRKEDPRSPHAAAKIRSTLLSDTVGRQVSFQPPHRG
jgi:hypothetical protein